ncbi:MAG: GTP 3',8-cyclase MoaA [Olsenella profusa]
MGRLKATSGVEQVTLTTNGVTLGTHLPALLDAGLDAVNVSLDTLRPQTFERITGFDCHDRVMRGIHDAVAAGLPVKVNVVLQRGLNLDEWPQLVDLSRRLPLDVRFIEAMPIGPGRDLNVVSNEWLLGELRRLHPGLAVDGAPHGNGPATYVRIPGYQGSTGFISAIHGRFCDQCNRMRLTSKGELKPCLCFADGVDVRHVFEEYPGAGVDVVALRRVLLVETIRSAIAHKPRQHCFEHLSEITETRVMSSIGG